MNTPHSVTSTATEAALLAKYDVPAPRYTSYPTVPCWDSPPTTEEWLGSVRQELARNNARGTKAKIAGYVHIPFCESLCFFCGCNTIITKSHSREDEYVDLLTRELNLYLARVPELKEHELAELHLGGGTPTFLSPERLGKVVTAYKAGIPTTASFAGSVEIDPRRTQKEHLIVLRGYGFSRVSLGVQDFNPEVQTRVNRIQPLDVTEKSVRDARDLGFTSVNFDLIYGLPAQTLGSIRETARQTVNLRPDRIALYSFANVPWIKPAHRAFMGELPSADLKLALYETSREILLSAGYRDIGMDHFALPTDSLVKSSERGGLHRNFMGYVEQRTSILLGIGVSSISETPTCFHQNLKDLKEYASAISGGNLPTMRGHRLSTEDQHVREQILKIMTQFEAELAPVTPELESRLAPLLADGLIEWHAPKLTVTETGRTFLRNICMALDVRQHARHSAEQTFSKAV